MLYTDPTDLHARASWPGPTPTDPSPSRTRLLASLESLLPPSAVLPPHRLHTLLTQALAFQRSAVPYLVSCSSARDGGLMRDVRGERGTFPLRPGGRMAQDNEGEDGGEVWNIAWSPDGRSLAAVGTSRTISVYRLGLVRSLWASLPLAQDKERD